MSFDPPIQRMRVEAFRGFRDAQEFDLNASAVIVTGPNGTGKTSFFDAMQWCLIGSIERLEDLRGKRNVEHIVNQYRLSDRASVELDLRVRGKNFTIRRTGDHRGSTLEFRDGVASPQFGDDAARSLKAALALSGDLTVATALSTSGLMQQDVMRAVLEAKPADRYRHLSSVLGLTSLEQFEEQVREVAKVAKSRADASQLDRENAERSVAATKAGIDLEEQRLLAQPQLDALREELLKFTNSAPDGLTLHFGPADLATTNPSGLISAIDNAMDLLDRLGRAREKVRSFGQLESPGNLEQEIQERTSSRESSLATLKGLQQDLEEAQDRNRIAEQSSAEMARLAAAALPLLTSTCPVCGQGIDADHVRQELLALSGETATVLGARQEVDRAESSVREAAAISQKEAKAIEELRVRQQAQAEFEKATVELSAALTALKSVEPLVSFPSVDGSVVPDGPDDALDHLRSVKRRLVEYAEAVVRTTDRSALERGQSELERLMDTLRTREERASADLSRARELKALADAALIARVEVTERRFRAVQPLVSDIYSRLDPHPAFKAIEFELDTYYNRGTTSPVVRDQIAGVTADPLMIFSTSQANIAALSYFLAMGWSAGDAALPFVLLDDPIQSMDDVNVLGFADLCRHLRQDRQLIISTHERRFAGLLERKLAPRTKGESTRSIKFVAWDRSGPVVEEQRLKSQHLDDPIRVVQMAS